MNLGFCVLCLDNNISDLKTTLNSIENCSYGRKATVVVNGDTQDSDLKDLKQKYQIIKGKNTVTSLINSAIRKSEFEWCFLIFSGSKIKPYTERKILNFIKNERDITYPIIEDKFDFVSGSINGMVINKKFFKEIGDMPECTIMKDGINDFELAKMFWCWSAQEKKALFKGIVGLKL